MIVAVDVGNSAIKVALVDGAVPGEVSQLDTETASEADLMAVLRRALAGSPTGRRALVAVSVVDRWNDRLARAAEALGLDLTVVAASGVPIRTALVRPDQVGPDRLLGAWAAHRLHGAPLIVVGMGTATTVDALDADGFFLGGAIMPGPALAAGALAQGTARLPLVDLDLPPEAIGTDTLSALRSGLVIGHVGAVRELVARMRLELGAQAPVVVTGGHARARWARAALLESVGPELPAVAQHLDPDLVLKGLGLLAGHRVPQPLDSPRPEGGPG
jgi:type III pantothenate kinase